MAYETLLADCPRAAIAVATLELEHRNQALAGLQDMAEAFMAFRVKPPPGFTGR